MRGITPKKINIKNDKKSIDIYRSSNNQNRNKIEILKIYKNLYFPKEEEYKGINKEETKVNLLIKNEINKNVQVKIIRKKPKINFLKAINNNKVIIKKNKSFINGKKSNKRRYKWNKRRNNN